MREGSIADAAEGVRVKVKVKVRVARRVRRA
jgi:hypothetical protein